MRKEFVQDEILGQGWMLKFLIPIPSWHLLPGNTSTFVVDAVVWIGDACVGDATLRGSASLTISHLRSDTEMHK